MKSILVLAIILIVVTISLQAEDTRSAAVENPPRVTRTWSGAVNTNWSEPGNWSGSAVPGGIDDAVIPSGLTNYPVVSWASYCKSIVVNTGAYITVGNANLNVSQFANIYGQLKMTGSGYLITGTSISWQSGATALMTSNSSRIVCSAYMTFYSGSNVQMTMGTIEFNGPTDTNLVNHSANTQINNLITSVAGTGGFSFSSTSTQPLIINGYFSNSSGYNAHNYYAGNITLKGSLYDYNAGLTTGIKWNAGTLIMDGSMQNINLQGLSSYVNHLTISPTTSVGVVYPLDVRGNLLVESGSLSTNSTVSIAGNLTVQNSSMTLSAPMTVTGSVTINTGGILSSSNQTITVSGNWSNYVGPGGFGEGTGRVIFTGNAFQYCNYTETFYTLEVNKTGGAFRINNASAVVTCAQYDWTMGAVDVLLGTFTANDLYDNGICGNYYVNPGATINLTNTDGYIDLNGNLTFSGGGTINVYGGSDDSYWPYSANASITMSGGVLDFKDKGIIINSTSGYSFTDNISGGTIRTSRDFWCSIADFNPTGGTIELYGSTNATLHQYQGSNFYNLHINKTDIREEVREDAPLIESDSFGNTREVYRYFQVNSSNLDLNGSLFLDRGLLIPSYHMNIAGDWQQNLGYGTYSPGTCVVIFDGSGNSNVEYHGSYPMYHMQLNKSGTGYVRVGTGNSIVCDNYTWISGKLFVDGGWFAAYDMADNAIKGTIEFTSGYMYFYQDSAQELHFGADLTMSGGEMHIYGGMDEMFIPYGGNASMNLTGGVINIYDVNVVITTGYTFTFNMSNLATIRVANGFYSYRSDFAPGGGFLEMFSSSDANLAMYAGSLSNLRINKAGRPQETEPQRSNTVTALANLDLNGHFNIVSGTFIAPAQMNVQSHWYNEVGPDAFVEGTGLVVFDGSLNTTCYTENFYNLELNKTGSYYLNPGNVPWVVSDVTCQSYNWTSGKLYVNGGSFTTYDMVDEAILGEILITDGSVHFHQDTSQWLDLRGNLTISYLGQLHLYGINGDTYWPYGGDASLTMDGGSVIIHDTGLYIYSSYIFNTNITGGSIMTAGDFTCLRSDFNPSGLTLHMIGSADAEIYMSAGTLYQLTISKFSRAEDEILPQNIVRRDRAGRETIRTRSNTAYVLAPGLTCRGNIYINSGKLQVWGTTLNCDGDLHVNTSGILELSNPNYASALSMKAGKTINVNSGGTFTSIGSPAFTNLVTNATGYTAFNVNSGGTIGAVYTILEKMDSYGVNVKDGAIVDLINPFSHCVFREGVSGGTLLTIDNEQTILAVEADFPSNTWSGGSNVSKNLDQGTVNFQNATGMWSGEMYDYDPFNRILWTSTYLPDLVITNAFWSDTEPLVGDLVTLTVTVSNIGVTGLTVPQVYLDFYYNMASPPTWGMLGNQYQSIASLPPGESQTLYFDVQYFTPGLWTSWLQIDTDYFQEELNEDNNVYGPIYLTWLPVSLPAITDLSIEIAPGTYYKRLNWTYSQTVSHFNIYRSSDPFFTPSLATFIANVTYPTMQYVDTTTADRYFYIVTAEQVAAALPSAGTPRNLPNQQRRNE